MRYLFNDSSHSVQLCYVMLLCWLFRLTIETPLQEKKKKNVSQAQANRMGLSTTVENLQSFCVHFSFFLVVFCSSAERLVLVKEFFFFFSSFVHKCCAHENDSQRRLARKYTAPIHTLLCISSFQPFQLAFIRILFSPKNEQNQKKKNQKKIGGIEKNHSYAVALWLYSENV